MKLYLVGHTYKYAVEQMLLTLFPEERPEYPEGPCRGEGMTVRLSRGNRFTTAACTLYREGKVWHGRAAVGNDRLTDPIETDRRCQRLVKNAVYRAALASEREALARFQEEFQVSAERAALCLDASRYTLAARRGLEERDVCLYVGIPFCPTRCAYCSFVSQSVEKSMKLIPPFLEALEKEIAATAAQAKALGLRPVSLYMGGGTPTTLSAEQLDTLCTWLERAFDLSALREYTVEAGRPDTITEEKLRVLRRHGADRVSVNPQTMSDKVLENIGRRHTAADIVTALDKVRAEGGFAVNMDLIAGLPGDSAEGFSQTLDQVLALNPENVTVHTLSLKKGSRITLEGTPIPDAAAVGHMLDEAGQRLRLAGYAPYYLYRQKFMSGGFENVGWTKPGFENLYNICIMEELCSILAMGGGGSTKLIRPGQGRNIRLMAPKYPLEYVGSVAKTCADKEKISRFYRQDTE